MGKYFKVVPGRVINPLQAFDEIYMVDASGRPWSPDSPADRRGVVRPDSALPPVMATPPTRALNPALGAFASLTLTDSLLKVTPKGGLFSTYTANGYDSWRNTVNPVSASSFPSPCYVDFTVDDTFDVKFRDNAGSSLATIWAWVDELDGLGWQRVTALTETTGASALNGGAQVFRYTFASSKLRKVRLFFKNCDFAGVRMAPTTVMQPAAHDETRVAILGDSWTANASSVLGQHCAFYTAALLLGFEPLLCGQAGTGYITPTGDANLGVYGDPRRTAPIVAANPAQVWVEGSINDRINSAPNPAAVQAAAASLFAGFATTLPEAEVVVFGPQSVGSPAGGIADTDADQMANRTAVQAAAIAAPNVLGFVDPMAEKWVTGTGNTTATTGVGPSDKLMNSQYHLGQFGHDTIAHRVARSVADVLNG